MFIHALPSYWGWGCARQLCLLNNTVAHVLEPCWNAAVLARTSHQDPVCSITKDCSFSILLFQGPACRFLRWLDWSLRSSDLHPHWWLGKPSHRWYATRVTLAEVILLKWRLHGCLQLKGARVFISLSWVLSIHSKTWPCLREFTAHQSPRTLTTHEAFRDLEECPADCFPSSTGRQQHCIHRRDNNLIMLKAIALMSSLLADLRWEGPVAHF